MFKKYIIDNWCTFKLYLRIKMYISYRRAQTSRLFKINSILSAHQQVVNFQVKMLNVCEHVAPLPWVACCFRVYGLD